MHGVAGQPQRLRVLLKHMLPEGARPNVHLPDGTDRTHIGIADPKR
jgi:hypothetical protein